MTDMGTIHFAKGSVMPQKQGGRLRLYSMKFCPYAQRVRMVLLAKNLPHDVINVNLHNKPDWIWKLHPEGKVPVLDTGSRIISNSIIICDYLDKKYPYPPLYPKNEAQIITDKKLIQKFGDHITVFLKVVLNRKEKKLIEYVPYFMPLLEYFDKILSQRGKYFGGDSPSMVDYMIWPWVERIPVANLIYPEKLTIPDEYFSHLKIWYFRMLELDTVKPTVVDIFRHHKFICQIKSRGPIDYDNI